MDAITLERGRSTVQTRQATVTDFLAYYRGEESYRSSILYYFRASRASTGDLGFVALKSNGAPFCFWGFRGGAVHLISNSWEECFYLIVDYVIALLEKNPVVIKKIPINYINRLVNILPNSNIDCNHYSLEDELHSEKLLDLGLYDISRVSSSNLSLLYRKYRRFSESGCMLKLVHKYPGEKTTNYLDRINRPMDFKKTYHQMFRYFDEHCNYTGMKAYVFIDNSEIMGLYLVDHISEDSAGLYCAIGSRRPRGITEWMDVEVFRSLKNNGYKKLYIGGSENEGVVKYVEKLHPLDTGEECSAIRISLNKEL